MKLAQLREAFMLGALREAEIRPYMGSLLLIVTNIENKKITMENKLGKTREFASVQAALNAAADIGFDKITIHGLLK